MADLQHVLSWLQRVLAPEYSHPERTKADIMECLGKYNSLFPRTDVFTYEDGHSVLLLCLEGTVPIVFRERPYNIPIAIWIPHRYPVVPPISFVLPSKNMLIRPGNYVDSNGRIYHPYLAYWEDNSLKPDLVTLCMNLASVFGKEPPLYAQSTMERLEYQVRSSSLEETPSSQTVTADNEHNIPIVPPVPQKTSKAPPIPLTQNSNEVQSPPPIPPAPHRQPMATIQGPPPYNTSPIPRLITPKITSGPVRRHELYADTTENAQVQAWLQQVSSQPPPQDIIERTPSPIATAPPPKPPNPERTILLSEVSDRLKVRADMLCKDLQGSISQAGRYSEAIAEHQLILDREVLEINRINQLCDINMETFRNLIQRADAVIKECENKEFPDIDQVLVAQTLVYNQLYSLVAEDLAIEDLLYVLAKGLSKERIELDVFMKFVRNLAREQFMKKALINKIREAAGLDA